jgi:hypothetical protein
MKLVSFLFFISWILPAVQSHEDGGNLRASQGQVQEHLQQELDQSIRNLNEEFQDERGLIFFIPSAPICNRIQSAFAGSVTCSCAWRGPLSFSYDFTCTAINRIDISGISGVPAYTGGLDIKLFQLRLDIDVKICLTDGEIAGNVAEDLCVGGSLCTGLIGGTGACGCAASYGAQACSCESCEGGLLFDCGDNITSGCINLPFIRSIYPAPQSVAGGDPLPEE